MRGRWLAGCAGLIYILTSPYAFPQTSQTPVVTGVVNAASYGTPVAPGSLISIFGSNLATTAQSASASALPPNIVGTSVTVNGLTAPLLFVSPGLINAEMPSTNVSQITLSLEQLVVTAPGVSQPWSLSTFTFGPAASTQDSSGCGAAAALNVLSDGSASLNSTTNSAAPGDYIALFGTGMGALLHPLTDGAAALAADQVLAGGAVFLDYSENAAVLTPTYLGSAPTLAGVDQVNFQIPQGTRNGCAVPVVLESGDAMLSPAVTISVNASRGPCVDPPLQSYGQVTIEKTIASGTSNDGERDQLSAVFPSAPGLKQPPVPMPAPNSLLVRPTPPVATSRQCSVSGYRSLSAGVIQFQAPGQNPISVQPVNQSGGVTYQQTLPSGSVAAGQYMISTAAGAPIAFQESLTVGSGINIQNASGILLDPSNPVITWKGGDANAIVRLTIVGDPDQIAVPSHVGYFPANAGSLTLPTVCTNDPPQGGTGGPMCGFTLPIPNNAKLILDVLPANGVADSIAAQGISQQVRFSWAYHYVFGGLSHN